MTIDLSTAVAHDAWDARWRTAEGRRGWEEPEAEVRALAAELRARGATRALDLGCGVGRHALHLASEGFEVDAIDGSPAGLEHARALAAREGLAVRFAEGLMTTLPYPDATFDYVLSWNVIYHGSPDVVARSVAEIARVLKPGGLYQGTMLTKRNANFAVGREVAPDTWVNDADDDKDHPHFYCDAEGLARLFHDFEMLSLRQARHEKPGSWHWHLVVEKP